MILALGAAAPTEAADVSEERLEELAERAIDDRAAAAELRDVDRVDGEPVDLERLLTGVDGATLDGRLRALAQPIAEPRAPAARVRADAQATLAEPRFQPPDVPRPFRGALETIGGWIEPIVARIGAVVGAVGRTGPGVWVPIAAAVLVAMAVIASRMIARRRTGRDAASGGAGAGRRIAEDPRELERAAEHAERRGERAEALRLRFRAGLLRLDAAGAISLRPSLPTGEVARALHSRGFDRLASDFDAVAYGGRRAEAPALDAARSQWPRVVDEARRR